MYRTKMCLLKYSVKYSIYVMMQEPKYKIALMHLHHKGT